MTTIEFLLAVALGLLFLVLAWRMPRLTRPDLCFAVTVPPTFPASPAGRAIVRRYRVWIALHAAIGLALGALAARVWPGGALVGLVWQNLGAFVAFLHARSRVLPHAVAPTTVREAELARRSPRPLGGWWLQLLPFALLAATAVYLRARWSDLPERFPVHWGIDGRVDRWATRDLAGVFGPLLTAAVVVGSLALLGWALPRFSRRVHAGGAAGEAEHRYRRAVGGVVLATEVLLAATFAWTALLPLAIGSTAPPVSRVVLAPLLATLLFTVAVFWVLARLGQGGARRLPPAAANGTVDAVAAPTGDRSLDRFWKAGVLYVNPDDPALFVEKRFGLGYTLNFARPAAWAILAAILLLPLALVWWLGVTQ